MKVKNIMFSGVMAAILGATGAHAALSVASQGYVDSKVSEVATSVNNYKTEVANTYLTQEDAADTYATTEYVTENVINILGDETDGLVADVAANKAAIGALDGTYATDTALTEGLAAKADKATTLAGYGITDAYTKTEADALLEAKQNNITLGENLQWTADGKLDTKGIATADGLEALEATVENHTTTIGEINTTLAAKADKTAVEAITNSLSGYATDEELEAVQATANAAATKTYVDTEFAKYTTTEGLTTKLADYALQTSLDAEKTARETADAATTEALKAYTKTADLDAGFVSESEMTEFKTANTNAINAKVAQSDYDTKVAALEAKDTELADALAKTIEMPAACETQDCVLSINKASGKVAWTPLTEPVSEFLNK